MHITVPGYNFDAILIDKILSIDDHCGGFDQQYFSLALNQAVLIAKQNNAIAIKTEYIPDTKVVSRYPDIRFLYKLHDAWKKMQVYNVHPLIDFKNFVCSFNNSAHVSRKLLVSILQKFGYFDKNYCSKKFIFSADILDGHITDLDSTNSNFYRKFFIADNSEDFFQTIHSFGHVLFDHSKNIYNLEHKLTESFLHIVSETMATSYYPFVTEKFLYSIVTRGLFLAYAQPGWHAHLEKYYGFKRYTNLFDYRFDSIQNPIERLIELITMISKFSILSPAEWKDLYLLEQDTIEYNYDHYFSQDYLKGLKQYE
jgi:hypothetical protein